MANLGAWVSEQRRTYFDNAGMVREYRTQLRGIKAPLFLVFYSGLFVMMASLFYFGIAFISNQSIAGTQQQLAFFYNVVVGMLEFLVALVAPVLAASSIIGEYQRQSIDLLFSSPVGPKYFLVGKLIASYRYVLLLLVLSLPVAAMCVVLGGATWKDVLSTYLLVSLHGLVYMAISIPIAVMTAKAVPAVMWSYLAGFLYFLVSFSTMIPAMRPGGFNNSAPPLMGLSPASSSISGRLSTEIFGVSVPLWVPAAVIVLLFVRLMILGAGSALTQAGSKETFNLRVTGLVLCFVVPLLTGLAMGGSSRVAFGATGNELATMVWWFTFPFFIFLPYLSTWAGSGGSKFLPNGWWRMKFTLRGTPGSGLPYLTCLLIALTIGSAIGTASSGIMGPLSFVYAFGIFALWALAWALGWAASSIVWRSGIESCRRLHVLFLFLVFVLPGIFLSILEGLTLSQGMNLPAGWSEKLNLSTFVMNDMNEAWYKIVIICVLAVLVWFFAERKRRQAVESMRQLA